MLLTNLHTFKDFIKILFYWKKHCLAVFAIIVGLVSTYAYLWSPSYLSSATVLVLPKNSASTIITAGNIANTIAPVTSQEINTEMQMLISDDVLRKTIQSFLDEGKSLDLKAPKEELSWLVIAVMKAKKAVKNVLISLKLIEDIPLFNYYVRLLSESLETEQVIMTDMFTISLETESPKASKAVLDRLLAVYIKHHDIVYSDVKGGEFYNSLTEKFSRELAKTENEINDLLGKNQIIDVELQNKENVQRLSSLAQEMSHLEVTIKEVEDRVNSFQESLKNEHAEITFSKEMHSIPAIMEFEKALVPLLVELSEVQKKYPSDSVKYRTVISQVEMLRANIRKEAEKTLQTNKMELQSLLTRKTHLRKKIDDLRNEGLALKEQNAKLQDLLRIKDLQTSKLSQYASKLEDTKTSEERLKRDLANVRIVDYPEIPVEIESPKKLLLIILSLFFGIFAAACTALALEYLDYMVKTGNDIETSLKLNVLSAYPEGGPESSAD